MEETKIVKVIRGKADVTYVTSAGTYIKRTANKLDFYSGDPRNPHDAIHMNRNSDGSVTVYERINGKASQVTIPKELLD